jgi:hypothetical protein
MGLDMELRKKHEPKDIIEKTIKALDFGKDNNYEEIFYWRKDYNLNKFISSSIGEVIKDKELKLTKDNLINILEYFKDNDAKLFDNDADLDYTDEIKEFERIIKVYDDECYVYYYWAWW